MKIDGKKVCHWSADYPALPFPICRIRIGHNLNMICVQFKDALLKFKKLYL